MATMQTCLAFRSCRCGPLLARGLRVVAGGGCVRSSIASRMRTYVAPLTAAQRREDFARR
jgi:hypothetical protein